MRGVYTSGVLEALDEAGAVFDTVVACSAGACAGASFLAGQTWRNRHIYLDLLDGDKLVRFRRVLTGGSIMDIDYLADDVTTRLCPLDVGAIRDSDTRFEIGVTDWLTGEPHYLNNRDDELLVAFRATCALPFFYRGEVVYRDRRVLDGGVSDPVPLERALALGATDIVVVLTSPIESRGAPRRRLPGLERLFSSSPGVRAALRQRHQRYRRAAEILRDPPHGSRIRVIRPSRELPVSRTTTDRSRLEAGCDLGLADGRAFLTRDA